MLKLYRSLPNSTRNIFLWDYANFFVLRCSHYLITSVRQLGIAFSSQTCFSRFAVFYQAFHLQVFCNCKEGVELFLGKTYFSLVHKSQKGCKVLFGNSSQVQKGAMLVAWSRCAGENRFQDRATTC